MIQFGQVETSTHAEVVFPTSYSSTDYIIVTTSKGKDTYTSAQNIYASQVLQKTVSNAYIGASSTAGMSSNYPYIYYIAIGY